VAALVRVNSVGTATALDTATTSVIAAALVLVAFHPSTAHGESPPAAGATERRSDFVLAVGGGVELFGASGYPNRADAIDVPAEKVDTGLSIGGVGSGAAGVALFDAVNVLIWAGGGGGANASSHSQFTAGGIRIEAFPYYFLPSPWRKGQTSLGFLRDLGLALPAGVGVVRATEKGTGKVAEGMQSFIGVSAFYDMRIARILGGHLTVGPEAGLNAVFSQSASRLGWTVGPRIVFYGGP
jgi:hypothetical protein